MEETLTEDQSPLRKALENNTLNLSKSMPLSGDLGDIPFVCVGDDAAVVNIYDETLPAKRFKSRQNNFQLPFIPREKNFRDTLVYLLIAGKYFVNYSY